MNPTPEGWPRISSAVFYDDAAAAIDWICNAFGFEVRMKVEDDNRLIMHSELAFGEGLIMVGDTRVKAKTFPCKSPQTSDGMNTQSLCIFVDDVDAHCEQARSAGAKIMDEPETHDYGDEHWADRTYRAEDPEGHQWWFMQRVR